MKKYEAVIFDLFGTLIDLMSDSLYEENSLRMASVLGVPADKFRGSWIETARERNLGQYGGLDGDISEVCARIGYTPDKYQIDEAINIRLEIIRRNHEPRAHAVDALTEIRSLGMKIGLLSDAPADTAMIWHKAALAPLMDAHVFSCDIGVCKPDPQGYRQLCQLLSVEPEKCLYIGDGGSRELTGAKSVGMTPALIRVGYESQYDSSRLDAQAWDGLVITSLSEVPALARSSQQR